MTELIPKGSMVEQVCAFLRARSVEAYLVGGYVRDWLQGRTSHDIDFAVAGDAVKLARRAADRMGGAFVLLDQERCTARVVTRGEDGQRLFIDFARLQGDDIIADLSKRDFTVNAIAVVVADTESPPQIIDPYDGQHDLRLGLVRAVSQTAFRDDPLRTLRAVRLEVGTSDVHQYAEGSMAKENARLNERPVPDEVQAMFLRTPDDFSLELIAVDVSWDETLALIEHLTLAPGADPALNRRLMKGRYPCP